MSDKKKHNKAPETPPEAIDPDLESEDEQAEEPEVIPEKEVPKKEVPVEPPKERVQTPEEVVASYEDNDVVIFRDTDGTWKEAKLTSLPQAVRSGGKVKYKFNVEGKAEAITSATPLKKVEGTSLVSELSSTGPVELNGKEYDISIPLDTSGNIILGPQGEEEYLLQEVGRGRRGGESRYIDVETVKSIYEAKQAKERFDREVHDLQDKVEQLQGIKTKELYTKLGNLKKDVERITKLMDFNIANSEDADAQELQKINARIEQLTEKIETTVRDLKKDIRLQDKSDKARDVREAEAGVEKTRTKDKNKIVSEVSDEIDESLAAADWRFEHDNGSAKKKYERDLKDWEARNKRQRDYDEAKRQGRNPPGPRPANPGIKPTLNVGEKPSASKEERGRLTYGIYKKRPESDPYVQAVRAEVAKKIERVVGRKVDVSKLDEEVLQLVGKNPDEARGFKKDEDEYARKKEALEAKLRHNEPIDQKLQDLQQEEQALQRELSGDIQTKQQEFDTYVKQEQDCADKVDAKRKELQRLEALPVAATDKAKVKRLENEKGKLQGEHGTAKAKRQKEIEARIKAIDEELAKQDVDAAKAKAQQELTVLEGSLATATAAREAAERDLAPYNVRKAEIDARLRLIPGEISAAESSKITITQAEKDEVRDKETALTTKRTALSARDEQERAEIYIGQIAEQVLESWKKQTAEKPTEATEATKAFDYVEEHKQLTAQTTTLRSKITQVPNKTRQKELKAQLKSIEDELAELDQDTPDVEKSMLKLWKDLGDLEVSIDEHMPIGSNDKEEPEIREVREARERRVVTRELPSFLIHELLDSRKIQFGEIVKMIYEEQLKTTTEQGVEVIQANEKITNLMKGLFLADMPPSEEMLQILRQQGIRDWKSFKELWDTQYASHVGMMLQEDAQTLVDQRVREEKMRLEGRSWIQKNITERGNPTDEQIREAAIAHIFSQDTVAGISVSDEGLAFYSRIMGTAMREINLELKMSMATTDTERAAVLKSFGRKAEDYVLYNGQYFVKNEECRMIRKDASNDIDKVLPGHEERAEVIEEIEGRIEESATALQEWRQGSISDEDRAKLDEHIKYFKEVLGASGDDPEKTAVVLAHYLTLQDEVKDLVHEYDRMRERKGIKEFERVARTVEKRGEELVKKDAAEGGVAKKIIEKAAPEAKTATPTPAGKSKGLRNVALAAALAVGFFVGGMKAYRAYDVDVRGPIPAQSAQRVERGGGQQGGSTGQQAQRPESGGGINLGEKRNIDTKGTQFVASNPDKGEVAFQPLSKLDFPSSASSYSLDNISREHNENLISAIRVVEQDNAYKGDKAKILKELAVGYKTLGVTGSEEDKKAVLDLAASFQGETDATKKKELHQKLIDKVSEIGRGVVDSSKKVAQTKSTPAPKS